MAVLCSVVSQHPGVHRNATVTAFLASKGIAVGYSEKIAPALGVSYVRTHRAATTTVEG